MKTFRLEIFSTKEEIREMEQELSRKYGERCVVLPAYMNPKEQNVAYLCDGYACPVCHSEYCHHTTDISHAKNFVELADGRFLEKHELTD